jgi:glycosyltransferase involved in cell wall biosynthesis
MRNADVLVLPNTRESEESERFTSPIKLFEYFAAGKPIVASDLPSIREIVGDEDVLFVPPGEPEALAAALASLEQNHALRVKLAKRSASLAAGYTWDARARRILDALITI